MAASTYESVGSRHGRGIDGADFIKIRLRFNGRGGQFIPGHIGDLSPMLPL